MNRTLERRDFLCGVGLGVAALVGGGARVGLAAREVLPHTPNVVFIMADDLGYAELGCYGQKKIRTPNIDALAREGMLFRQYYTGSAVCAPARCTLMTGQHGGHAYVRDNSEVGAWDSFQGQLPLPGDRVTLAGVLKARGYVTGAFGKWGLGAPHSPGDPLNHGFDRFFGYNCQRHAHNLYPKYLISDREKVTLEGNERGLTGRHYAPQVVADEMLRFIRQNEDKPFFVYYPTVIPHLALQVPAEDLNQYQGQWPETPYDGSSYLPHPTPRACYAAMISFMDRQVGRLMRLLKHLDLDDNTVVFFTSDNGTTHLKDQVDYDFFESVGTLRGLKGTLYEGGIRVPLIVRWPEKIRPGVATDHLAAHYDVLATVAEIAGAEPPQDTDGISFLATLLSNPARQRKHAYLFWDFAGYGGQLAVRMGKWKGLKRDLRKNPAAPLELYDLEKDLSERNNVADAFPEVRSEIERIMVEARRRPAVKPFQFGDYAD